MPALTLNSYGYSIVMNLSLREMEVRREINRHKAQISHQRKLYEESQTRKADEDGSAIYVSKLMSVQAIGATRKNAHSMVVPNSGVVASVIAQSVNKKSTNCGRVTVFCTPQLFRVGRLELPFLAVL